MECGVGFWEGRGIYLGWGLRAGMVCCGFRLGENWGGMGLEEGKGRGVMDRRALWIDRMK